MEFLLITGAAVLIAILIDRNIDKIDIPKGLVDELSSQGPSHNVLLGPHWASDDRLKDFFEDMDPSLPGTSAWAANKDD